MTNQQNVTVIDCIGVFNHPVFFLTISMKVVNSDKVTKKAYFSISTFLTVLNMVCECQSI